MTIQDKAKELEKIIREHFDSPNSCDSFEARTCDWNSPRRFATLDTPEDVQEYLKQKEAPKLAQTLATKVLIDELKSNIQELHYLETDVFSSKKLTGNHLVLPIIQRRIKQLQSQIKSLEEGNGTNNQE